MDTVMPLQGLGKVRIRGVYPGVGTKFSIVYDADNQCGIFCA